MAGSTLKFFYTFDSDRVDGVFKLTDAHTLSGTYLSTKTSTPIDLTLARVH